MLPTTPYSQQLSFGLGTATPQAAAVAPPPVPSVSAAAVGSQAAAASLGSMNPAAPNGSSWWNNVGDVISGIGTLGSVWAAIQANKIAKKSLAFKQDAFNKNYNNQVSSYNTALSDRAWARAAATGQSANDTRQYIENNSL